MTKGLKLVLVLACLLIFYFTIEAHPGIGIVENSEGVIFYTDLTHVWKIYPDGRKEIAVRNVHTHELRVDKEDNIYGSHEWYAGEQTDKWYYYLWRLSKSGEFTKIVADTEGFPKNNGLLQDEAGNEYWAEKKGRGEVVKKTDRSGKVSTACNFDFNDIRWLCLCYGGEEVFIVDKLDVYRLDSNGEVELLTSDLKKDEPSFEGVADHHYVMGVWSGFRKEVYIAVFGRQELIRVDARGDKSVFYQSETDWSPCGGYQRENGSHIVLEFSRQNEVRVVEIDLGGKAKVL